MNTLSAPYDSILLVAFGGPEIPSDVMPFLERVTRGRNIPRERLEQVAEHYHHFGGRSPLNDQVRALLVALRAELDRQGVNLPVYWGNRNWHPLLNDALNAMTLAGHKRALALVLAAYSSYSSCRQYRENIDAARAAAGPNAPQVDKVRVFYNHPDFIAANADCVRAAVAALPDSAHSIYQVAFTAHSIPSMMAAGCDYEKQLRETCRLVAEEVGLREDRWTLVYQSRSGRPEDPWLEPDILDHIDALQARGVSDLVIHPVGFLSDHMEVLYDLDEEAKQRCAERGIRVARASTVGTHPRFVSMLAGLIEERITGRADRTAIGRYPANHDVCPADCCPAPTRRPATTSA